MTLDPSDLRLRIDEAFGGMPYPGDEQIVTHNRGDCSECERTQNALKGLHWRDLLHGTLLRDDWHHWSRGT